jgi:hypothetical protein
VLSSFADGFFRAFFNTRAAVDAGFIVYDGFLVLDLNGLYRTTFFACSTPCTFLLINDDWHAPPPVKFGTLVGALYLKHSLVFRIFENRGGHNTMRAVYASKTLTIFTCEIPLFKIGR